MTTALAVASLLLSVGVFVARGAAVVRATRVAPGVAVTSGYEEESMLALWRTVHGQAVYVDSAKSPFAAAYFNWLFYAGYRAPVAWAIGRQGDPVLPLAGRLVTAAGAVTGAALLFWVSWRRGRSSPVVAAAVSAFVFFGPLTGWWAYTIRPDVWALTFEVAALGWLLTQLSDRPWRAALVAAPLFYAAWALKQSYVLGLVGALSFLLVSGRWRPALALALVTAALGLVTLAALGPVYRAALLEASSYGAFAVRTGSTNLADMVLKTIPLWVLAAASLLAPPRDAASDLRALGRVGLLVSLPLAFVASCKTGASSNYFLTPVLMLALTVASEPVAGWRSRLKLGGLIAAVCAQALVATGRVGHIDLARSSRGLAAIWSVWRTQPEPRFSSITSLDEPWLNAASPPFVLPFNYAHDRRVGRSFEDDGLGGLVARGFFASLLLPDDVGATFDGASLVGYRRGETIEGMTVYRRIAPPQR